MIQQNYHASKSLLLSDRSATLSFLALWKVASQTIFHFPADMISCVDIKGLVVLM